MQNEFEEKLINAFILPERRERTLLLFGISLVFYNCGEMHRSDIIKNESALYINNDSILYFQDKYTWVQDTWSEGHQYSENHRQKIMLRKNGDDSTIVFKEIDFTSNFSSHNLSFSPPYISYITNTGSDNNGYGRYSFNLINYVDNQYISHLYSIEIQSEVPYENSLGTNVHLSKSRNHFTVDNFVFETRSGQVDTNLSLDAGFRIYFFDNETSTYLVRNKGNNLSYYDKSNETELSLIEIESEYTSIRTSFADSGNVLLITKTTLDDPTARKNTYTSEYFYIQVSNLLNKSLEFHQIENLLSGYFVSDIKLEENRILILPEQYSNQSSEEILEIDFNGNIVRTIINEK